MKLFTLFLLLSAVSAHAWSLIEPSSESCKKQWEAVDGIKRGEIEAKLLRLGLSSTGNIKVQKIYRLTHDSKLGKTDEKVGMFIQEDLFGERLFWVAMINLNTKKVQLLYDAQNHQNAEQGSAHQPATR